MQTPASQLDDVKQLLQLPFRPYLSGAPAPPNDAERVAWGDHLGIYDEPPDPEVRLHVHAFVSAREPFTLHTTERMLITLSCVAYRTSAGAASSMAGFLVLRPVRAYTRLCECST